MGVHQEFKKANSWKGGRGWLAILKPEPENLAYCWAPGYPPSRDFQIIEGEILFQKLEKIFDINLKLLPPLSEPWEG